MSEHAGSATVNIAVNAGMETLCAMANASRLRRIHGIAEQRGHARATILRMTITREPIAIPAMVSVPQAFANVLQVRSGVL